MFQTTNRHVPSLPKRLFLLLNGLFLQWLLLTSSAVHAQTQVNNPFVGAQGYIDPDYVRSITRSIELTDTTTAEMMKVAATMPTAVWLDSIAAIDGSKGRRSTLEQHLLNAVKQGQAQSNSSKPVLIPIVIYNLPDRDCSAKASNGTLLGEAGLAVYQTDFIDRIAALFADPRFAALRIVAILEPDSLPNLVTNQSVSGCKSAFQNRIYTRGIAYALKRFGEINHVYSYLDMGHSGWLGWDDNINRAVSLYVDVIRQSGSVNNVHGVATNTSGYAPVEEIHLPDPDRQINNKPVKSARFYQYNPFFDERDYAIALKAEFSAAGMPNNFGVLIDTSRNGWGGEERPTQPPPNTITNANAYVAAAKIDRRPARNNWCNQRNAGMGERPTPDPYGDAVIHAFVWIKPPGESDGTSDFKQTRADAEGKRFDANCDPRGNDGKPTNALGNAPAAGRWFHEHFETLVRNAYPPLIK